MGYYSDRAASGGGTRKTSLDYTRERQAASAQMAKSDSGGKKRKLPGLGIGTVFKELGGILPGLAALASGKGGYANAWTGFGKGIASSFLSTAANTPLAMVLEKTTKKGNPYEVLGQKVLGEQYKPKDYFERASERGLISPLIEDIGNVAILGAAATAPLKVGSLGKAAQVGVTAEAAAKAGFVATDVARAAEAFSEATRGVGAGTRALRRVKHPFAGAWTESGIKAPELRAAGKAAAKAEGVAVPIADRAALVSRAQSLKMARCFAHPYKTAYHDVLRPLTGAMDLKKLAAAGRIAAEGAEHATNVKGVSDAARAPMTDAERAASEAARSEAPGLAREALRQSDIDGLGIDPNDTVTLYRGENPRNVENVGEGADRGAWYTDNIETARAYAGEDGVIMETQVPRGLAETVREPIADVTTLPDGTIIRGEQYKLEDHWRALRSENPLPEAEHDIFARTPNAIPDEAGPV